MAGLGEFFARASDAVFAIDGARRIVYRNQSFCDLFPDAGAPARCYEVLRGRTLDGRNFCGPECPVGKSLVQGHSVRNFDLVIPGADGDALWVNVGSFPLSKPADRAVAVCLMRPVNAVNILNRLTRADDPAQNGTHKLTPREREILRLLAEGRNTKQVAAVLHISHVTARNHIQHIFEKLGVHSRAEAVSFVYRHSLL